jgi:aryl-alcohol dehydrogenase-like predicted oxidoreductase
MQYRTLGKTDLKVSILGFGGATLGDVYGTLDPAEGERAVHAAINQGINYFDVAPYYGLTLAEERLGQCLEGRRDKVVLSSKCCRYGLDDFDFSAKRVEQSIDESLKRLRTSYLDLYIIHDVEFGDRRQVIEEAVPAARRVQQSGKARYVGISGLPPRFLRSVAAEAPVDAILSYCHYNLLVDDLDTVLRPFAAEQGIGLINASPLHMGILSDGGPQPWHPAPPEVKEAGRKIAELCKKRRISPSMIALGFCLANPHLATTLVGISSRHQLEQNLRALTLQPDPGLMKMIQTLVMPVKNKTWLSGQPENQE